MLYIKNLEIFEKQKNNNWSNKFNLVDLIFRRRIIPFATVVFFSKMYFKPFLNMSIEHDLSSYLYYNVWVGKKVFRIVNFMYVYHSMIFNHMIEISQIKEEEEPFWNVFLFYFIHNNAKKHVTQGRRTNSLSYLQWIQNLLY